MTTPDFGILILSNSFAGRSRGYGSVSEDLATRFSQAGMTVWTASSKPARLARLLEMVATIWKRRNQYAVAQVDVFSGLAFIQAEVVCRVLSWVNKPYILTLHGGNLPSFSRRWSRRVRRLLRSAAAITAPSPYLMEELRPYHFDIVHLPNPLSLEFYEFRLRKHAASKLIWLRQFHHVYNPDLAARVVADLADDFPDVQLELIGPDQLDGSREAFEQLVVELGMNERVNLRGGVPKSEVPDWLNRGDIFLNTSSVDNAPVSIVEAMACGLCIVSTQVGGIPHLLEHEQDALLVPPDDSSAMASAVRRILTEPGLSERLSRNARRKSELFDWGRVLSQWRRLLWSVSGVAVHE